MTAAGRRARVKVMTREEIDKLLAEADDAFLAMTEHIPRQTRSRETLGRLLDAAETLLTEGGLDAATVPAIAERAAVSVGVVYRRFPDKDALLRAVYLRFFARLGDMNRINLALIAKMHLSLAATARKLIEGMVKGYRMKRGILRALILYARTHHDPEFRRAAQEMNRESTAAIAELFLTHQSEIDHPHPRHAIEFGLLAIGAILGSAVLEDQPMHGIKPANLEEELIRLFLRYLGIDAPR